MKEFDTEKFLNQQNKGQWGKEQELPGVATLLILVFVATILVSTIVLMNSMELSDTIVDAVEQRKKKLEYLSLALFYANIFFVLNSLFSGGFTAISEADILTAVSSATHTSLVSEVSYDSTNFTIID